jgi:hypothetical protein
VRGRHGIGSVHAQRQPVCIGHVRVVANRRGGKCPQRLYCLALCLVLGCTILRRVGILIGSVCFHKRFYLCHCAVAQVGIPPACGTRLFRLQCRKPFFT